MDWLPSLFDPSSFQKLEVLEKERKYGEEVFLASRTISRLSNVLQKETYPQERLQDAFKLIVCRTQMLDEYLKKLDTEIYRNIKYHDVFKTILNHEVQISYDIALKFGQVKEKEQRIPIKQKQLKILLECFPCLTEILERYKTPLLTLQGCITLEDYQSQTYSSRSSKGLIDLSHIFGKVCRTIAEIYKYLDEPSRNRVEFCRNAIQHIRKFSPVYIIFERNLVNELRIALRATVKEDYEMFQFHEEFAKNYLYCLKRMKEDGSIAHAKILMVDEVTLTGELMNLLHLRGDHLHEKSMGKYLRRVEHVIQKLEEDESYESGVFNWRNIGVNGVYECYSRAVVDVNFRAKLKKNGELLKKYSLLGLKMMERDLKRNVPRTEEERKEKEELRNNFDLNLKLSLLMTLKDKNRRRRGKKEKYSVEKLMEMERKHFEKIFGVVGIKEWLTKKEMKCQMCNRVGKKRCANCVLFFYCSIDCQKKDWKNHKKFCTNWRK